MHVSFQQFGGLAAGIKRPSLELDLEKLPADEAVELQKLISAARSAAPYKPPGVARPDAMSYRIEVRRPDGSADVWEASDSQMPATLGPLVAWLRGKRRKK